MIVLPASSSYDGGRKVALKFQYIFTRLHHFTFQATAVRIFQNPHRAGGGEGDQNPSEDLKMSVGIRLMIPDLELDHYAWLLVID